MNNLRVSFVLLLLFSSLSFADFIYAPNDKIQSIPQNINMSSYALVGNPLVVEEGFGDAEIRHGMAQGLPLGKVLSKVAPRGWKTFGRGIDFEKCTVSFVGGIKWTDILENIMRQAGANATISWARKVVMIQPDASIVNKNGTNKGCERSSGLVLAYNQDGSVSSYSADDNAPRIFILRKGKILSKELIRWGLTYAPNRFVSWEIDYDYKVKRTASFKGNFIEAITQVVQAYQDRRGLKDVFPVFSNKNRTVSVQLMRKGVAK